MSRYVYLTVNRISHPFYTLKHTQWVYEINMYLPEHPDYNSINNDNRDVAVCIRMYKFPMIPEYEKFLIPDLIRGIPSVAHLNVKHNIIYILQTFYEFNPLFLEMLKELLTVNTLKIFGYHNGEIRPI